MQDGLADIHFRGKLVDIEALVHDAPFDNLDGLVQEIGQHLCRSRI